MIMKVIFCVLIDISSFDSILIVAIFTCERIQIFAALKFSIIIRFN